MSCPICVENYDDDSKKNKTRSKIECNFCHEHCCRKCLEKYLIGSSQSIPHCMYCKHEWSMDFLANLTPNTFHNVKYRDHQANILMEKEISLLPTSQNAAMLEIEKRRESKRITEGCAEIKKKIAELQQETYKKVNKLQREYYELRRSSAFHKVKEREKTKFIRACLIENCRGFLSSQWKCGTCETKFCSHCMEQKEEEKDHLCDPDKVKTTEMLKINTKPCPSCGEGIFKAEGCRQMHCTSCNTPFDWNTGKKIEGLIHNPHYFEWQRNQNENRNQQHNGANQPINNVNLECGGMPDYNVIVGKLRPIIKEKKYTLKQRFHWRPVRKINEIDAKYQLIHHIRDVVMPRYNYQFTIEENEDLRVRYLINELNKDEWLKTLKKRNKKAEKDREVHQALDMFTTLCTDIFQKIAQTDDVNELKNQWKEMEKLRDYTNNIFERIQYRFKNKAPKISENWQLP